jgi:hypothetical protein
MSHEKFAAAPGADAVPAVIVIVISGSRIACACEEV